LWQAFACAQDLEIDARDFVLRLKHLVDLGVDENDLRGLVLNGCVDHADAGTAFRNSTRHFRSPAKVAFGGETRFLVAEAGAAHPGDEGAYSSPCGSAKSAEVLSFCSPSPRWDHESRVLYLGGQVVKRFKRPSPNQDRVLSAFEEEGWPNRIYDPLPPKDEVVTKNRLHATIKWLNLNQETRLLRFRGDGTGECVCWERVDADTGTISAAALKKPRLAA
jgi:hypothetical protein